MNTEGAGVANYSSSTEIELDQHAIGIGEEYLAQADGRYIVAAKCQSFALQPGAHGVVIVAIQGDMMDVLPVPLLKVQGAIVSMSSAASLHGVPYSAAYCASKAGINGLTRSIAVEYADQGLRINAVCPGGVDTPLNRDVTVMPDWLDMEKIARLSPKTGRLSDPEEIAAAVAYLASDEARSVTGTTLSIDGGQPADRRAGWCLLRR